MDDLSPRARLSLTIGSAITVCIVAVALDRGRVSLERDVAETESMLVAAAAQRDNAAPVDSWVMSERSRVAAIRAQPFHSVWDTLARVEWPEDVTQTGAIVWRQTGSQRQFRTGLSVSPPDQHDPMTPPSLGSEVWRHLKDMADFSSRLCPDRRREYEGLEKSGAAPDPVLFVIPVAVRSAAVTPKLAGSSHSLLLTNYWQLEDRPFPCYVDADNHIRLIWRSRERGGVELLDKRELEERAQTVMRRWGIADSFPEDGFARLLARYESQRVSLPLVRLDVDYRTALLVMAVLALGLAIRLEFVLRRLHIPPTGPFKETLLFGPTIEPSPTWIVRWLEQGLSVVFYIVGAFAPLGPAALATLRLSGWRFWAALPVCVATTIAVFMVVLEYLRLRSAARKHRVRPSPSAPPVAPSEDQQQSVPPEGEAQE